MESSKNTVQSRVIQGTEEKLRAIDNYVSVILNYSSLWAIAGIGGQRLLRYIENGAL